MRGDADRRAAVLGAQVYFAAMLVIAANGGGSGVYWWVALALAALSLLNWLTVK